MSNDSTRLKAGILAAAAAFGMFAASQQASAAAFALKEQSVTYLGDAFAGTASTAEDASTGWYNPAGLTELKNHQMVASATYVYGRIKLYNATATNNLGLNVPGSNVTWPRSNAIVPGLHLAIILNKCLTFGFGVTAPYGLVTDYENDSIARYMATTSKLSSYNLSPSVGWRINDQFSLGAAFDAMRLTAEIDSATRLPPFTAPPDGFVNNKGHAWSYGFHAGLLYKPSTETSVGLVYFSVFNPRVVGTPTTSRVPNVPTSLSANVKLPDRVVYSVTHAFDSKWTGMGEVEWTHWNRLKELRIVYNTGSQAVETLNYQNTWRVSFGTNYKWTKACMFKGGVSWDQTPVTTKYRTARLPDSNRYWVALGVKYTINKYIAIDAAYSHLFFNSAKIAQRGGGTDTRKSLYGNYKSSADLVGLQLTWNFV